MRNSLSIFIEETPEVQQGFDKLVQILRKSDGMDEKTKQLIFTGIKTSRGETGAVVAHTRMLKKLGATRDEVKAAILISILTNGLSGVSRCLEPALEAYDNG